MFKNWAKSLIWIVVVIMIAGGSYGVVRAFKAPLAPALTSPTATASTAADTLVCNESGSKLILWVGDDAERGVWPYGADLVRLLKVDYSNKKIVMIAFPRDLLVSSNGDQGSSQQRLGLLYYQTVKDSTGSVVEKTAKGADILAKVFSTEFGVQPDNYLVVDMSIAEDVIDSVGGIEVDLPETVKVDDKTIYQAGKVKMNGVQAVKFASFLDTYDEAPRYARQQLVMEAFFKKANNPSTIAIIPDLIKNNPGKIITDLSVEKFVNLGCLVQMLKVSDVSSYEILGESFYTKNPDGSLTPNDGSIADFLKEKLH